jgi:hypothetical protein
MTLWHEARLGEARSASPLSHPSPSARRNSAAHGTATCQALKSAGVSDTAAFVAGGVVTVASTSIALARRCRVRSRGRCTARVGLAHELTSATTQGVSMAHFSALLIENVGIDPCTLSAPHITVALAGVPSSSRWVLVDCPFSWSEERLARTAGQLSSAARSVLVVKAETSSDTYLLAEFNPRHCVRRIAFMRDADPQWSLQGEPRSWEADLLFALPLDDLLDRLSDDDTYTDQDIAETAQAYATKTLASLRRRPPLLQSMLFEWLRGLGINPGAPNGRAS